MNQTILIIDDENKTRSLLVNMVKEVDPSLTVFEAHNLKSGLKQVQDVQPNIVLLDINLPDGTGFDLLELIENRTFSLIFITAHENHAIKAIKEEAVDYLLKPVDLDELSVALDRAKSKFIQKSEKNNGEKNKETLLLKTTEAVFLVNLKDIVRCESSRNYTTFYLEDGRKILTSKTLKDYDILDYEPMFFRCHRSHVINLAFFDRYERANGGFAIMKDKSEVPISRSNKELFFMKLEEL